VTNRRKRLVSLALGLVISVVLLYLVFHEISFSELVAVLKRVDYLWVLPNMVMLIFSMYQRAWRWAPMLRPIKEVDFSARLSSTCIGFMANNVLPLRLGEFVRAYSLARQDPEVSKSASLATIFIERMVFDLVALLAILGLVFAFSSVSILDTEIGRQLQQGTYIAVAVAVIGTAFVLLMVLKTEWVGRHLVRSLFFLPEKAKSLITQIILRFSQGLEFIRAPKAVLSVSFQTLLIWILLGVSNYFVFIAFGFDLPLTASFMLLVIVSVSILIPSSPGFVGVYHAGVAITLRLYGIPTEQAGAFALVLHAAQYVPITAMGFYFLKVKHLSLKTLEEEAVDEI
jgi:uncharacterized protein (TIRG00374 family)